jgi:hypothetical protein
MLLCYAAITVKAGKLWQRVLIEAHVDPLMLHSRTNNCVVCFTAASTAACLVLGRQGPATLAVAAAGVDSQDSCPMFAVWSRVKDGMFSILHTIYSYYAYAHATP